MSRSYKKRCNNMANTYKSDNIIVKGSNPPHVSELEGVSYERSWPLHYFLRIEVNYFEGGINLNRSKYVVELLSKIEMTLAKVVSTSLDAFFYRMIVVRLQYLILTRLDITHHFIKSPNIQHLQGVKRILRYIKCTIHFRLRIISQSPCRLYGYSDADLGGCTTTRRSTTSYSINLGANFNSWTSKKQNTVTRSSAETEYRELASTATALTWTLYLLYDLGMFF
uniref:Reverse transcriptase Ty1/copia-type domain-containing protein n=1 Tax=Solanum lycopersicum TaxID=4081 RepID=A0A3Q7JBM3_SOLLC